MQLTLLNWFDFIKSNEMLICARQSELVLLGLHDIAHLGINIQVVYYCVIANSINSMKQ